MKPEELNPENDPEVRITALLLGELTPEEETELRAVMAQTPELMRLHDRLKVVMGLVKDAVPTTEPLTQSLPEPMTLAEERRAELLAVFKGAAPKSKAKKIIKVSFWQRQKADLLKLAAMLVGLLAVTWMMVPKREEEFGLEGESRPTGILAYGNSVVRRFIGDAEPMASAPPPSPMSAGVAQTAIAEPEVRTALDPGQAITFASRAPSSADRTVNALTVLPEIRQAAEVGGNVNLSFSASAVPQANLSMSSITAAETTARFARRSEGEKGNRGEFIPQAQSVGGATVGVPLTASEPATAKLDDSMNRSAVTRGSQIALPALAAAAGEQEVTRKMMADPNGRTAANSFSSSQNQGAIVSGNSLALNDSIAGKPMASPGQSGQAGGGGVREGLAVDSVKLSLETQEGRGLENGDLKYKSTAAKNVGTGKFQFGVGHVRTFGGDADSDQKNTTEAVTQNSLNVKDKVPVLGDLPVMGFSSTTQLSRQAKEGQSGPVSGGAMGGGVAGGQTQWGFGTQNGRRGGEPADGPKPDQMGAPTITTLSGRPGNNDMFLGGAFKSGLAPGQIVGSGGTQPSVATKEYSAMGRTDRPVIDAYDVEAKPDSNRPVEAKMKSAAEPAMAGEQSKMLVDNDSLGLVPAEPAAAQPIAGPASVAAGDKVDSWRKAREEYQPQAGAKEKASAANQMVNGLVIAGTTMDINGGARTVLNGGVKGVSQLRADASGVTLNYADAPEMPTKPNGGQNFAEIAEPHWIGVLQRPAISSGAVHADANGDRAKMTTLGDAQKDVFFESPAATPTPVPAALPQSKEGELRLKLNRGMTLADVDGDGAKVMSQKQDGFNLDVVDLQMESKAPAPGVVLDPQPEKSYSIQDNAMRLGEVSQKAESFEYRKQPLSEVQRDEVTALAKAKLSTMRRESEDVLAEGLKREGNGSLPSPAGTVSAPAPVVAMDLVADGTVALRSDAITLPTTPSSGPVDASAKGKKQDAPENQAAHYYMELAQEQKFGEAARKRDSERNSRIMQAGGILGRSEDLPVANPYARNDMAKIKSPTAQGLSVEELKKGVTVTRRLEVDKLKAVNKQDEKQVEEFAKVSVEAKQVAKDEAAPQRPPSAPAGIPQPEVSTALNAFSTFSLNVSDVSFKLAAASLEKGLMPEPATVRTEEFINAFNYHDAEPTGNARVAFAWERARYPFAHDRDLVRFAVKTGAVGREPGKPLNIVLLLDNSGSMERADRVQIRRECLRVLGGQLQAQDTVSVVAFARTARLWVDGLAGNKAEELQERVGNLTPEGGTNLEEAMNLAYATAQKHFVPNGVNRVVLLTDGAANLGDVSPDSLKKKVVSYRQQGVALDCFGIGWEGYNDDLLEALSRNGDGRYGFVNSPEAATTEFASQLAGALQVAASDVKVQVEWNPKRVTVFRQLGYAKHQLKKEEFRDNKVDAAEIGAAEAGNALYTVQVNPAGEGPLGVVRVRYRVPNTSDYREHEWTLAYDGASKPMEQASVPLRLAATASAFSEWLVASPFAGEVTAEGLITQLSGVPEAYPADPRPKQLEWMIRQAKSLSGR